MKLSAITICFIVTNIVTSILAIFVIAFPIIMHAKDETYSIPTEIREWGGVIIGYYFGSSLTIFLKAFEKQ